MYTKGWCGLDYYPDKQLSRLISQTIGLARHWVANDVKSVQRVNAWLTRYLWHYRPRFGFNVVRLVSEQRYVFLKLLPSTRSVNLGTWRRAIKSKIFQRRYSHQYSGAALMLIALICAVQQGQKVLWSLGIFSATKTRVWILRFAGQNWCYKHTIAKQRLGF